jgi:hypothetical protein
MAELDFTKEIKNIEVGQEYCIRCARKIGDGHLSMPAHYNYNTFEIKAGYVRENEVPKCWFNNVVIGNSCAKKIGLTR